MGMQVAADVLQLGLKCNDRFYKFHLALQLFSAAPDRGAYAKHAGNMPMSEGTL
ncbi:hypothetical protein GCM10007387_27550 [Pseudoduganella albidiflava]|uniref:Uncharacterized protein n=1 Tax=Pseudoduganella albidiflava TaxID=321983 RepID=A0AA88C2Z7_9BURK|nr:hypothetical protein GCM10007387_27550 [Pseudoduganella albidiflava]